MSFERAYEKGLRDSRWGRSYQALGRGRPASETGAFIKCATCSAIRMMSDPQHREADSTRGVIVAAGDALERVHSIRTLFPSQDADTAVASFERECAPFLRTEENSRHIELAFEVSRDKLRDAIDAGPASIPSRVAFERDTMTALLIRWIEATMRPAVVFAAEKRHLSPPEVERELGAAIENAQLPRIAAEFMAGKGEKLRAPATPRRAPAEFLGQSLIRVGAKR